MNTYYKYDDQGFLCGSISVSRFGTRPVNSTIKTPPEPTNETHPRFNGEDWYLADKAPLIEKELNNQRVVMTKAVTSYIHSAVYSYNKENGTAFDSVHNCAAYKDITSYSHHVFCNAILEWNAVVWDMARAIESEVAVGNREIPSVDELIEELPKFDLEEYHA